MKYDDYAFPVADTVWPDGRTQRGNLGMSLRDYFAASAMNAELISSGALPEPAEALAAAASRNGRTVEEQIASNAYALADAMLARRLKQ